MAILSDEMRAFIVQGLACFDTPSQVAKQVKDVYGIDVPRQQVEQHDPTKYAGRQLRQKWVDLFNESRSKFKAELIDIPIANRAVRLRVLNRMAQQAEERKNYALTAQLLEQAAKEVGEQYTNKSVLDHRSTDGSMTPKSGTVIVGDDVAQALASKLVD